MSATLIGFPCLNIEAEPFELRPRMVPLCPMAEYNTPDQRGLRGSQPVELPQPRVHSQVRRRTQPPPEPEFSWKEFAVSFALVFLLGCIVLGVWL
jgi:hypothetical protein